MLSVETPHEPQVELDRLLGMGAVEVSGFRAGFAPDPLIVSSRYIPHIQNVGATKHPRQSCNAALCHINGFESRTTLLKQRTRGSLLVSEVTTKQLGPSPSEGPLALRRA